MKEVKKEKWENEKEGGESPPRSFVSNTLFLFYILKFLLAKLQQNMFYFDKSLFFLDRSSSFRSGFACQIVP